MFVFVMLSCCADMSASVVCFTVNNHELMVQTDALRAGHHFFGNFLSEIKQF